MGRVTSTEVFVRYAAEAMKSGETTKAGKQRHREGRGLHELVDPKGYGVIRRSISWLEPSGDEFILLRGVAMLEETRLDTTGSMGNNVDIAMRVLPKTYDLLAKISNAVLGRYDVQMITSIFGDEQDHYILCRSQAEMDERIAEQMTLMVPEGDGGDSTEDPQYGLFAAAYLTRADIWKYGLKSYDFTITDAPTREYVTKANLVRVFGEDVFARLKENDYDITENNLPKLDAIVRDLQTRAHAFLLGVNLGNNTKQQWQKLYGKERVIDLPRVELLPAVKAAIIGLTEGVLDLQSLEKFLIEDAEVNQADAAAIKRAVAGIPIGAQMALPNFDKIPLRGATFAQKGDFWPATTIPEEKTNDSMWN